MSELIINFKLNLIFNFQIYNIFLNKFLKLLILFNQIYYIVNKSNKLTSNIFKAASNFVLIT